MKLHGYYRSSTSYRVRIALGLKKLAFEYVPVNLLKGEQRGDAFAAINPHQTVPALEVDGDFLVQSLAIIDWLENSYPKPSFLPTDKKAAHLCKSLYYAIASEIHAPLNPPILKHLREEFGADSDAINAWYAKWITRTFAPVEKRLAEFDWISPVLPFGEPSLFEIVLIPQIYNARRWNVDLSKFPKLRKIEVYCNAIEAFQLAHPDNQPDTPPEIPGE